MTHSEIDSRNHVESYILGKLPPDEASRFEEHFVDCPTCLDQMEAVERFRAALPASRIAVRRWPVAWAVAASLALALGASLFFAARFSARESDLRTQLEDLQRRYATGYAAAPAPLVASTFFLTLTRGEDSVNRVTLPSGPAWIALSPDADTETESGNLRAAITDANGAVVWPAERTPSRSPPGLRGRPASRNSSLGRLHPDA